MNQKKTWLGMAVMALAFGMMVIGCPNEPDDEPKTYTVWIGLMSYSYFQTNFEGSNNTLNDGYYVRIPLTDAEFNSMSLTNEGKQNWTRTRFIVVLLAGDLGNL